MKRGFLLVFLTFGIAHGLASTEVAPVIEHVRELIATPEFRERWNPVLWEGYSSGRNDPNGGYLLRFAFTLGVSERPLYFVASDRFGETNKSLPAWDVYRVSADARALKVANGVALSTHGFFVDPSRRALTQPFADGSSLVLHIARDGSVRQERRSSAPDGRVEEIVTGDASLSSRFVPEVEKIPLAAFLRSPQAQWLPLRRDLSVAAQSLDTADEPLLRVGADLSWSDAVTLVQSLPSANPEDPAKEVSPISGAATSPSQSQPQELPTASLSERTARERSAAGRGWMRWQPLILLFGIVVACWVIWKRRRQS